MGGSGNVAKKRVLVEAPNCDATIPDANKSPVQGHGDEWPGRDLRSWKQATLFDSTFQRRKRAADQPSSSASSSSAPVQRPPISPSLLAEERRAQKRPKGDKPDKPDKPS